MTIEALSYLNESMEEIGIPYGFRLWNSDIQLPRWVGDYTEIETVNEDGMEESTFTLTGFAESSLTLEQHKALIKAFFPSIGRTEVLSNDSALAVSYETAFPVDTGKQGLYQMQISLNVKEWKGE